MLVLPLCQHYSANDDDEQDFSYFSSLDSMLHSQHELFYPLKCSPVEPRLNCKSIASA